MRPHTLRRRRVPTVDLVVVLNGAGSAPQLVQTLCELKSISYCPTRYGQSDTRRCQAAERRAAAVGGERRRACAQLDEELFGMQPGQVGPMQARLNSFPPIRALVIGSFGEWSAGLADLLATFSHMGADAWMARMGAPSRDVAQAALERHMRLQLAACVVPGHAQLLLVRAQMARGQTPPQRRAGHGAQADVDACGGVDGACCRRRGGGSGGGEGDGRAPARDH